jgi:hypothetical protein
VLQQKFNGAQLIYEGAKSAGDGQFEDQLFGSVSRSFQSLPHPLTAKFQVAPHSATRCKAHDILAAAKTERTLKFEMWCVIILENQRVLELEDLEIEDFLVHCVLAARNCRDSPFGSQLLEILVFVSPLTDRVTRASEFKFMYCLLRRLQRLFTEKTARLQIQKTSEANQNHTQSLKVHYSTHTKHKQRLTRLQEEGSGNNLDANTEKSTKMKKKKTQGAGQSNRTKCTKVGAEALY